MSDNNIKVKSHSNQVLDLKGNVLQSTTTVEFKHVGREHQKRPDEVGSALLQARHLYNNLDDVTDEVLANGKVDGGVSYLQDSKYRFLRVHYYAYGLFWSTLLKAFRNRPDLKAWSPEIFAFDEQCAHCNGLGKIPYVPGTPVYEAWFKGEVEHATTFGDELPKYGTEVAQHCSDCQGVGFIFNRKAYKEKNPS